MYRVQRLQSAVFPLIIINVVVFVLQILVDGFTNLFVLDPAMILQRPWQLVTSMFLHANTNHIFFNMYGLLIFGPLLEQKIGTKRFLMVYFTSGIMAAIGHIILSNLIYGAAPPALGASGAVMGMLGTMVVVLPDLKILFLFFIPMSLRTAGFVWAFLDVIGVFVPNGVANLAHLAGMATGILFGFYFGKQKKIYRATFTSRSHMSKDDLENYLKNGRL